MWKRNTTGLREAGLKRRAEAITRVEEVIKILLKDEKNITFNAVIQAAGVSKSWLYGQPELRARINALRKQTIINQKLPEKNAATDNSKDTMISALRSQIKDLRSKIDALEKQLQVAYGLINNQDFSALQRQMEILIQELEVSRQQTQNAVKDHQRTMEENKILRVQNNEITALKVGYEGMEAQLAEAKKQNSHLMNLLQREQHVERKNEAERFARAINQVDPFPDVEF
jgi:DNA repair exonuclease SbcCD ATPase subunit